MASKANSAIVREVVEALRKKGHSIKVKDNESWYPTGKSSDPYEKVSNVWFYSHDSNQSIVLNPDTTCAEYMIKTLDEFFTSHMPKADEFEDFIDIIGGLDKVVRYYETSLKGPFDVGEESKVKLVRIFDSSDTTHCEEVVAISDRDGGCRFYKFYAEDAESAVSY